MKPGSILEAIIELSHERGLEQESIIEAIEDAIVGAAYRKYKNYRTIEASFNKQNGEIDLMHYKVVVEAVQDPDNEIALDEVIKLDPMAECGDEVEYEIDAKDFSKVIAQTARQLIFQKIREAERESIIEKYTDKKGEIIHGTVSRIERGKVIILIGNSAEAILDRHEQIPHEKLQPGDHVRAILIGLNSEGRGPQLIVSRTHPDFLIKLFEVEVPEVYEGIIEMMVAAREPGKRAKVAVYTNDPDVDPVGACVGPRGARVQAIVSELCDERIDVVEWSNDLEQFISNSLAPADIMKIELNQDKGIADIQIAQDQLSLAIGKQGQNVRLASKLTGIMINITAWDPPNELKKLDDSMEAKHQEQNRKNAELQALAEKEKASLEVLAGKESSEFQDAEVNDGKLEEEINQLQAVEKTESNEIELKEDKTSQIEAAKKEPDENVEPQTVGTAEVVEKESEGSKELQITDLAEKVEENDKDTVEKSDNVPTGETDILVEDSEPEKEE